jgi:hypothetical protein
MLKNLLFADVVIALDAQGWKRAANGPMCEYATSIDEQSAKRCAVGIVLPFDLAVRLQMASLGGVVSISENKNFTPDQQVVRAEFLAYMADRYSTEPKDFEEGGFVHLLQTAHDSSRNPDDEKTGDFRLTLRQSMTAFCNLFNLQWPASVEREPAQE